PFAELTAGSVYAGILYGILEVGFVCGSQHQIRAQTSDIGEKLRPLHLVFAPDFSSRRRARR
ncbi:MAG: hypothetical protein AAFR33_14700, partial [Pseudomonadota bacterium]